MRVGAVFSLVVVPGLLWLGARGRSAPRSSSPATSPAPRGGEPPPPRSSSDAGARPDAGPFRDMRRLKTLDAIVPEARPHFEALIAEARRRGFTPQIISAVRTCTEQKNMGSKASTTGRSWHALGRAVDLEFAGAKMADYQALGEWWKARGGAWGGDWITSWPVAPCGPEAGKGAGDPCHFQWTPGTEIVPRSLWPDSADCTQVTREYLAAHGSIWSPERGWLA